MDGEVSIKVIVSSLWARVIKIGKIVHGKTFDRLNR
jgi:hypothetical protein